MPYPEMSFTVPWSLVKGGFHRTPHFETSKLPTRSRRGSSALSFTPYATWDFEVDLEAVPNSIVASFVDCYMQCLGGGGYFLFTDPADHTVSILSGVLLNTTDGAASPMSQTGDGSSQRFQLARTVINAIDIIQNPSGVTVFVAGTPTSATITSTGEVVFSTPPAAGAALSWQGTFSYLCRFTDDSLRDLARISKNSAGYLWSCSSITFESEFV